MSLYIEQINKIYRGIIMKIRSTSELALVFEESKITTNDELIKLFDCSRKTAQRHLKALGAINSYNQYGRYYTLMSIAEFDRHGIWAYKNTCFSKFGNLRQTVIGIIKESQSGLTGEELGKIVRLNENSFLSHFRHDPQIYRQKFNKRYVYFASEKTRKDFQLSNRKKQQGPLALPGDEQAIMILIKCIKLPNPSSHQIARELNLPVSSVEYLLAYHGIELKKKRSTTPDPNQRIFG